jgi:hypothetical protein
MNDINDITLNKTQIADKTASKKKAQAEGENFAAVLDQAMTKTQNNVLDRERQVLKQREKNKTSAKKQKEEILPAFVSLPIDNFKTKPEHATRGSDILVGAIQKTSGESGLTEQGSEQQTNNAQAVSLAALNKMAGENEELAIPLALLKKDVAGLSTIETAQKNNSVLSFQNIYQEMIKEATAKKEGAITKLRLVLLPEELGELEVNFVLNDKKLQISIAASEETKKLIQGSENELKNLFAANGFQNVDLSFTQFSERRDSGSFSQQQNDSLSFNNASSAVSALNVSDKNDIIDNINVLITHLVINYLV